MLLSDKVYKSDLCVSRAFYLGLQYQIKPFCVYILHYNVASHSVLHNFCVKRGRSFFHTRKDFLIFLGKKSSIIY
jgi:hypothetical protein